MVTLILGLSVFLGIHLLPALPDLRSTLRTRLGQGRYKLVFSLLSAAGLALIIIGYKAVSTSGQGNPQLWTPFGAKPGTAILMLLAFILLASAYIPSRIRTAVKHPMLTAILLWALAHLLVRADLAGVLLFGSFLIYAIVDRVSVMKREAPGPLGAAKGGLTGDISAIAAGTIAFAAMTFGLHHGGLVN